MTLPIEWSDILNIPEDTSSVRIDRHGTDWKHILDQVTSLPQLTHLEFGQEITSVKFIEALLESKVMPNVEHLVLPNVIVSLSCWLQLHALQGLHIQSTITYSSEAVPRVSFPKYPFSHFTALTSLQLDVIPSNAVFNQITPHLPQLTALSVGRFLSPHNDHQLLLEPIWKMTRLRELTWPTQKETWGVLLNDLSHLETLCLDARLGKSIPWIGNITMRSLTLCGSFGTQNLIPALTNMSLLTQLTLFGQIDTSGGGRLEWPIPKDLQPNHPQRLKFLKSISAMHSLSSFTLELAEYPQSDKLHLTDWIQHLTASLQSLHLAHVFLKQELDWQGFDKFTQLSSLDLDDIGNHRWSDFNGLWSQLPTTLTSLTLKAEQMHPGWMNDLPDLPHLTWLAVLESTAITQDPYPSLPALLEAFTTLYDKFPELMRLKRFVRHGVREEWILLQQYRKRLPLTFWATHPLHPDRVDLKAKEQALRRDADLHNLTL